ncbi:MAG: sulfotransferase domain-containing protein [Solirubrobacterales bacterium]
MATPDSFLCSYPKSGRTWMRFALVNLMNDVYRLGLELDMDNMFALIPNDDGGPEEVFYSQPWKTLDKYRFADHEEMPFVAMSHLRWEDQFEGTIDEFSRDERFGIPRMVDYLASWAPHAADPNVEVLTYEELRADPFEPFRRATGHLGIEATDDQLQAALEASSVERMREVERASGVGQPNEYDKADPQAMRVRKAKVGGWREELPPETVAYMMECITGSPQAAALLDRYGLTPEVAPA